MENTGDLNPALIRKLETEDPVPPKRTKPKSIVPPTINIIKTTSPALDIVIFISPMLPP